MQTQPNNYVETTIVFLLASILVETSPQAVPLGAACTASALKTLFPHFPVKLISISLDEAQEKSILPEKLLAEKIVHAAKDAHNENSAKKIIFFIGFSAYVWNVNAQAECAKFLRTQLENAVFFAGGPSAGAEQLRTACDFIVEGAGEKIAENAVFIDFLVKSIHSEQDGVFSKNPLQKIELHQKSQNGAKYVSPWLDGTLAPADYNGVLWELARGCPYNCAYCSEAANSGEKNAQTTKTRFELPLDRLENELDFFASVHVPQVYVLDPAFTANKERAQKLLALMAQKLPDAHFQIEVRVEQLDIQLVKAFSHLICSLQIGLQSSNQDVLTNVGRTFDRKTFARKIALLNENGIVFGLDLIFGLPADTLPSFKESIDYAVSLLPNHLDIFRLSVLPNTQLHERAKEFGLQFDAVAPHLAQCTPKFSRTDMAKAEELAFACTVFYSAGRAVPWFKAVLQPLKIKSSQFFADFAEWQRCNNCAAQTGFAPYMVQHTEIERMQLAFVALKFTEKKLDFALQVVYDLIRLNGACARAVGEGEETILELSYYPEDILEVCDVLCFAEETCIESCRVRVFAGSGGPDMQML